MSWLLRNRHMLLAVLWAILFLPTLLWWKDSILWVAFLSLYANFASELATHHALKADESSNKECP